MKKLLSLVAKKSNNQTTENQVDKKIQESYATFLQAASSTISLAEDVTNSLRDRLDDYINQISALSEVMPCAVILTNDDGTIESVNQHTINMFGYTQEEIINSNIDYLFKKPPVEYTNTLDLLNLLQNQPVHFLEEDNTIFFGQTKNNDVFYITVKYQTYTIKNGLNRHVILIEDISERVRSEQEYVRLSKRTESIINSFPDILITVTNSGEIITVHDNKGLLFTQDDIGKSLTDTLCPSVYEFFNTQILSQIDPFKFHEFTQISEYSDHIFRLRIAPCQSDYLLVIRDITQLKKLNEAKEELEFRFRAFANASSEAMLIHIGDTIVDFNENLVMMTGYSGSELKTMSPADLIHPLERNKYRADSSPETDKTYETLAIAKNGDSIEISINEKIIEYNNHDARIKIVRDISKYKDVNQILSLSRERYRSIIDNTFDLVYSFNKDMKITFANKIFYEYFDMRELENSVINFIDVRDQTRLFSDLSNITAENRIVRAIYRIKRSGVIRWIDVITRGIYDNFDNFVEYQAVARDVTEYISRKQ